MSNIFLNALDQEALDYDGFFDGQNKTIPEGTELEFKVIDGFVGIEEGKSQQVCMINIQITTEGEFKGQKYRYNAKIFDMDSSKRDLAMRNLGVLDAQAGFPMTNGKLELTTENIQDFWVGQSNARVKFGLLISEDDGREINFVRGFAYWREMMVGRVTEEVAPKKTKAKPVVEQDEEDEDLDF